MSADGMIDPVGIRQGLSRLSREAGENLTFVLERFAAQRLLYRLSRSEHRNSFALKGAMLLAIWSKTPYRATRDIDLLGWGEDSAPRLERVFRDLCNMQIEDGLLFDCNTSTVEEIRENQEYGGFRVKLRAYLGTAWVNVQVDVGFGDVITPRDVEVTCPTMLDFPSAILKAYPRETVVAEKVEAIVRLGLVNGRMKDLSDLYHLSSEFSFDGQPLCQAVGRTFSRRQTELPVGTPVGLTERFYDDPANLRRWLGFLQAARLDSGISLSEVCEVLGGFLLPILTAARSGGEFDLHWKPSGPWLKRSDPAGEQA